MAAAWIILVEAMGRVNYGPELHDRKGVRQIRLNNQVLFNWDVYTLPLIHDALRLQRERGFSSLFKGPLYHQFAGGLLCAPEGLYKGLCVY